MDNSKQKLFLGCGTLTQGNGGISSVSRMMLRSFFEEGIKVRTVSLLDAPKQEIYGSRVKGANGSHLKFVTQSYLAATSCQHMIYDHIGLARAAPRVSVLKRDYSVWIHGSEVLRNMTRCRISALKNAKCVLVNSNFTLQQFEEKYFKLPNVHVCPLATENPLNEKKIENSVNPPTVGILSRISNDGFMKGHVHLINSWPKVLEKIPDAKLIIAGEGNGLKILRSYVSQSPVSQNIEILGRLDGNALETFWQRTDVLAMPSKVEGFGLVYVEAMQRSIPVIASIHDAGNEVNLDGVTGFNVNLDEPDTLAAALINLLGDYELREKMGKAAHAHWDVNYQFSAFKTRFLEVVHNNILA